MKKEDFLSLLVYLLMLVVALVIGLQIIGPALDDLNLVSDIQRYGFAGLSIIIGLIVNVVLFELGHVFGALLGGYSVISINVLGLAYYKTKEGWKFKFRRFEGLTGQTIIIAKQQKTKPYLYLFGPTVMVVLEFVIAIIVFLATKSDNLFHHASLIVAGVGAMLLVYNIMPFKLDNFTDGYYIVTLNKKVNVEAYNELIRIESLIYNNEEIKEIKTFAEVTTMTARVSSYTLYELIDAKKWDEALALIAKLEENSRKIEEEFIGRIKAQKLYIYLLTKAGEAVSNYWFNELTAGERKFISNDLTLETMRCYLLYSGLVTKSRSECAFVINRAPKALKNRISDYRKDVEIKLFTEVFEQIVKEPGNEDLTLPELK